VRAGLFVRHAQEAIVDLPNLPRVQNRHNLAYDACHDLGEALPAWLRVPNDQRARPARGPGPLRAVLDSPPGQREARR